VSKQQVAIITGAGRGIGAATAKLFANKGYAVCINYKSDEKSANQLAQVITGLVQSALPCKPMSLARMMLSDCFLP